jgi:hypothetical protein
MVILVIGAAGRTGVGLRAGARTVTGPSARPLQRAALRHERLRSVGCDRLTSHAAVQSMPSHLHWGSGGTAPPSRHCERASRDGQHDVTSGRSAPLGVRAQGLRSPDPERGSRRSSPVYDICAEAQRIAASG